MKYRSTLEQMVGFALGKEWFYEPWSMPYSVPRKYTPDFVRGNVIMEVKGYFREGDTQKYRAIKEQCWNENKRFIMLLQNSNKKVRKGSHLTMAGWCDKNGIPWYDLETVERIEELFNADH